MDWSSQGSRKVGTCKQVEPSASLWQPHDAARVGEEHVKCCGAHSFHHGACQLPLARHQPATCIETLGLLQDR